MPQSTASHQRLRFIDRYRGIGMLLILLYHTTLRVAGDQTVRFSGYWWDPFGFAPWLSASNLLQQWLQVPALFFVFSGYLIHRSLARHAGDGAGAMLLRRSLRLYIPYLVVLAGYGLVWPHTRVPFDGEGVRDMALHVLLLHNSNDSTLYSINASFWYVATELQLCALYPLAMLAVRRYGWLSVMATILALDVAARGLVTFIAGSTLQGTGADTWLLRSPLVFAIPWYVGAWIADLQRRGTLQAPPTVSLWTMPLAGLVSTVLWPLTAFASLFMSITFALWMAAAIAAGNSPARVGSPIRYDPSPLGRAIDQVGTLGLGIFLLNQPVVNEVHWRVAEYFPSSAAQLALTPLIALAILFPAAWIMARVIEEPLARGADVLLSTLRRRAAAPPAQPAK